MNTQLLPGRHEQSEARTADQVEITTTPIYPTHGTQKARLLAAMLAGRQINPLTAWREFGAYRLADVVFQLKRKNGWPVRTDDLPVRNTFGEECVVGLYSLDRDIIDAAGDEGQRYVAEEREVLREMRRGA